MKEKLLFIDTETIGQVSIKESCVPFEIGAKVLDTDTNEIIFQKSYIVRKFFNNKYIMYSSFSATKYPNYFDKINNDKRYKLVSVNEIKKDIEKLKNKYNITKMVAHNGKFDKEALERLFNDSEIDNPFESLDLLDTMTLSMGITQSKEYEDFCLVFKDITSFKNNSIESDFISNSGRVRITAQAIYCYITKNPYFKESHTALEDIDIEIEIFKSSMKTNPNYKLNYTCTWREFRKIV